MKTVPRNDDEYADLLEKLRDQHSAPDEMTGSAVRTKLRHLFGQYSAERKYVGTSANIVEVMAGVVGATPQESGSAGSSEASASDAQTRGLRHGGVSPVAAPSEPTVAPVSSWPFGTGIALMKSVPGRLKALALSVTAHYWPTTEAAAPAPVVVDVKLPLGRLSSEEERTVAERALEIIMEFLHEQHVAKEAG